MIACCGVIISNDKFLMIKRGNEPYRESWGIPGGRNRDNENLEEACIREMKEEVNLKVEIIRKLIFLEKNDFDEKTIEYLEKFDLDGICFFLCKPISNLNNIKISSDATDFKWLSREEALKVGLTPATREFLNRVNI